MTPCWTGFDGFILDSACVALPQSGDWSENLSADFCADVLILGAPMSHFADWDPPERAIELNERSLQGNPGRQVPGHRHSGPLAWADGADAIEMDAVAMHLAADCLSMWKPHYRSLATRSTRISGVLLSALIHVSALFLFVFIPVQHVGGSTGHGGTVITVQVAPSEDLIPQDESPASIDSAASLPSIAKKTKELPEKPVPESVEQPPDRPEPGPRPAAMAVMEQPKPPDKEEEQKEPEKEIAKKSQEQEAGDGLQDSVASTPSTASAERRFIPASGQAQNPFDSLVLSAIRESIFFPKQAVNERHYGEVVVAFAINRDGSVSDLNVEKSSGSRILDEAATKIIQKAAKKFPPMPETMYREKLEYVVPILFKERKGPENL